MAEGTSNSQRDIVLLLMGAVLIACCVAIAHFAPATFQASFLQMRVLTALGGALLGTALPGIIGLEVKGIRAVGAVSFVVLFFLFTPRLAVETSTNAATQPAAAPSRDVQVEPLAPKPAAQSYVNSPSCQGDNCKIDTSYDQSRGSAR